MIERDVSLLGVAEAISDSMRFMENEKPTLAYKRMIRAISDIYVLLGKPIPDTEEGRVQ